MKKSDLNKCCSFELAVLCQQKGLMIDSLDMYIVSTDEVRLIQGNYSNKNDYNYIVGTYECYVCFTMGQIIKFLEGIGLQLKETSSGLFIANNVRFRNLEDAIFYLFSFAYDINHKEVSILTNHLKLRGKQLSIKPQ